MTLSTKTCNHLITEAMKHDDPISLEICMSLQRFFNISSQQPNFDLKPFYEKIMQLRSPENLLLYDLNSLLKAAVYFSLWEEPSFHRIISETFQEILFLKGNDLSCKEKFICYLADLILNSDESKISRLLEKHIEMEIVNEPDLEVTEILKIYIRVSNVLKSRFAEK